MRRILLLALSLSMPSLAVDTTYEVNSAQLLGIRDAQVTLPSTIEVDGKVHKFDMKFPASAVYSTNAPTFRKPLVFNSEEERNKRLCEIQPLDDRFQWQAPRLRLNVSTQDKTPWDGHTLGGKQNLASVLEGTLVLQPNQIVGSKKITHIRIKETARDAAGKPYYENLDREVLCKN